MEKLILSIPFYAKLSPNETFALRNLNNSDFETGPYPEGFNIDGNLDCIIGFREFEKIQRIPLEGFSSIIILFRAIIQKENPKHLIIGFYEIDKLSPKEIAPGIYNIKGQSAHFVNLDDTIDVSDQIIAYNLQNKVLRSNSLNHPEYKTWLQNWFENIKSKENKFLQYKEHCLLQRQKMLG